MMIHQTRFCLFSLFCLTGNARVWLTQQTDKLHYTAGETAVIQCNLHADHNNVKVKLMKWVILDPQKIDATIDLPKVEAYASRQHTKTSGNSTVLTLANLTMNDNDTLLCFARYYENRQLTHAVGHGTVLDIFNKVQPTELIISNITNEPQSTLLSWINYLLLSVNILFLFVATSLCVSLFLTRCYTRKFAHT
ncbi:hypothetical protein AALO_G00228820 [Alosa alosa]|uniref:Ig-like domain-containing protein n=1 Tax=Alosa alosa TaxID=278164 RepID=A0AAV6FYA6_9TELE|nr:hypothetical protein AALO_G00228820 [Alosa alosa]